MPEKVNLSNEELQAAVAAGLFSNPAMLDKLDTESRQRYVKAVPAETSMRAPSETDAVTLGDWMDDPRRAAQRTGELLKRDATDPKTWLALAAAYFGPKAVTRVAPAIGKAMAAAPRVRLNRAGVEDIQLNKPFSVLKAIEVKPKPNGTSTFPGYDRYMANSGGAAPATSPVETPVAGGTPPPADLPVPAAPSGPATPPPTASATPPTARPHPEGGVWSPQRITSEIAIAARRAKVSLTGEDMQLATKAVEQGVSPAEAVAALKVLAQPPPHLSEAAASAYQALRKQGKSVEESLAMVEQQTALNEQLGLKTPTVAQTKFPKGWGGKVPPKS